MNAPHLIRPAVAADAPAIHALICELADYEKMSADVVSTPEMISDSLASGHAEAQLAEIDGAPVGFALFFHNYSTFLGRPGIYLEDLYVQPAHRGCGIGKSLLLSVTDIARERGCQRMDWTVLDWNQPSIEFYESLGAKIQHEWLLVRLDADALARLDCAGA
ncbi:MAG: GNAT family N-acetyltransferase [Verrucomicrobiae bacterium]|nr:GNAT family N-acetyltransferase [Verrucomicrobiae bacterium]